MVTSVENPVLPGDHPDPSIVRVGDDYYVVSSTFQYFPAVLILHSRDLVRWTSVGHVCTDQAQLDLTGVSDSHGAIASDISHAHGRYWAAVPLFHNAPRCTILLYSSESISGPWDGPHELAHHHIDPSIFHDERSETCYLVMGAGWVQQLASDHTEVVGDPVQVWAGTGGAAPEGAHLFERDGWYYLLLAEGGTFFDHAATLARSRSVWGPYEPCPHNPILHQPDSAARTQKAGHGDFVVAPDGSWWFVHLGGRVLGPERSTPLGRETNLQPVRWTDDGWPVVGDDGVPCETVTVPWDVGPPAPPVHDELRSESLGPDWEWVRHPPLGSVASGADGLRLECAPVNLTSIAPAPVLTRRWTSPDFSASVVVDLRPAALGDEGGLVLYRDTNAHFTFAVRHGWGQWSGRRHHEGPNESDPCLVVERSVNGLAPAVGRVRLAPDDLQQPIELRLEVRDAGGDVRFTAVVAGREVEVATADTTVLAPEHVPVFFCFTAPRVGLFARGVYGRAHGRATFTDWRQGAISR